MGGGAISLKVQFDVTQLLTILRFNKNRGVKMLKNG